MTPNTIFDEQHLADLNAVYARQDAEKRQYQAREVSRASRAVAAIQRAVRPRYTRAAAIVAWLLSLAPLVLAYMVGSLMITAITTLSPALALGAVVLGLVAIFYLAYTFFILALLGVVFLWGGAVARFLAKP